MDIIPTLHYLSKDLRELKHLFENYKNLISKITALGKPNAQAPNGHVEDARRVMLTDTALSRFERLGDRLQYLMVNSIEGYLGEISAVSSTVRAPSPQQIRCHDGYLAPTATPLIGRTDTRCARSTST